MLKKENVITEKDYLQMVSEVPKEYTVELNGVKHTGTFKNMKSFIKEHNLGLHYSETKDEFIPLSEMHINHLANSIVVAITQATSKAETKEILISKEFQEFVDRYDEYLEL